jgi:predicted MFS family arabinose efflux permease
MPTATAPHQPPAGALAAIVITVLLTIAIAATYGFGLYLFAQLVTDMRADLGFGYDAVGIITASAQLGFLLFAVIGSWLAPRMGGGAVIAGSLALCGACLVTLPMTDSIIAVGILLTILGGTAASVYVPMVDVVARMIALPHRGKVLGLVASGTSYGVFVNSLLVPVFAGAGNWRGAWFAVGIGTLTAALATLMAFRSLGLLNGQSKTAATAAPQTAKGTFATFRLLLAPWVLTIWAITFFNGFSTMPFQNYLSPYLREELGLGVDFAAWVWRVIGIVGMFAGFILGWMSDRTGVRAALLLAYACFGTSALVLAIAPFDYLPIAAGLLFATAFYPIFGLVSTYVANTAQAGTATIIFGVANVTLGIGGMSGNYLASLLKNLTDSFVWIYAAIAIAAGLLGLLAFLLPRESKDSRECESALEVATARCS